MLGWDFGRFDQGQLGIGEVRRGDGLALRLLHLMIGLGRNDIDRFPAVLGDPNRFAQSLVMLGAEILLYLGRRSCIGHRSLLFRIFRKIRISRCVCKRMDT